MGKQDWIKVENTHEPIIDKALWNRVQELIQQKAKPFLSMEALGRAVIAKLRGMIASYLDKEDITRRVSFHNNAAESMDIIKSQIELLL